MRLSRLRVLVDDRGEALTQFDFECFVPYNYNFFSNHELFGAIHARRMNGIE